MLYNNVLDTFVAVAKAGSFNKAAEALFISAPAVIKQVNSLEHDVGLRLFVRTHRGLTLTEAGKSLYKDAVYMIQYSQEALHRANQAARQEGPCIRIGTSLMTPVQVLLDLWPHIHELIPDIKFRVIPFDNTPENARAILRNLGENIDIVAGVFDDGTQQYYPGSPALKLRDEPVCCAVGLTHRLSGREKLTWEDLSGETLYVIKRGWAAEMDALRDELERHHPDIHVRTFDFYDVSVFNACENGDALLVAFPMWKAVHPLLRILPVAWPYSMPYGILHSPQPDEVTARFLTAVENVISQSDN
ncbi:LysR family transcriptional regulator [uncultured Megasphaera sp.]|uniref:LysR family transcriptional regulator n=1 Tax=uncultured Megasphaera sp. TaxID=165188 RepID=UPI002623E0B5|nr:LysR family transcriptional regulator [uncultured Megasphaera sp.]